MFPSSAEINKAVVAPYAGSVGLSVAWSLRRWDWVAGPWIDTGPWDQGIPNGPVGAMGPAFVSQLLIFPYPYLITNEPQPTSAAGTAWGGVRGSVTETGQHSGEVETSVEAVAELGEVAGQMRWADRVVSAMQGLLDVAKDGVEPAKVLHLDAGHPTTGDNRLVFDACGGDTLEITQTIGEDDAVGVDEFLGPRRQLALADALDHVQVQVQGLTVEGLGERGHEGDLVGRTPSEGLAMAFRTPVDSIKFDHARTTGGWHPARA